MHRPSLFCIIVILSLPTALAAQGGNSTPLTIYKDARSWPHVFANSAPAAYFGLGRSQMRDLPVSTAFVFAEAAGELASVLGPGLSDVHIASDRLVRNWRVPDRAVQLVNELPPDIAAKLRAYVTGVNQSRFYWLANVAQLANDTAPLHYDQELLTNLLARQITLEDVIAHGVHANGYATIHGARAIADGDETREKLIMEASNSWVVGPRTSASGAAITLADPHLPFQAAPVTRAYFAQMSSPAGNVAGITFPGWPCIAMGFTPDISWAITTNNPDMFDVWSAPLLPGGESYSLDGIPVPIIRQTVAIAVYDADSDGVGVSMETLSWAGSVDYPIVREETSTSIGSGSGQIWFARGSFMSAPSMWEFFIRLSEAPTVGGAFTGAFALNAISFSNFLLADSAGNVGYIWAGRVPVRGAPAPGTEWYEIQDGSSSAFRWSQIHPATDLPFEYLPGNVAPGTIAAGSDVWVQCNARADLVRPNPTINLANHPDYMVHAAETIRNRRQARARELLDVTTHGAAFAQTDSEAFATDSVDLWARDAIPLMNVAVNEWSLWGDPFVADAMLEFGAWDRINDRDARAPLLSALTVGFHRFYLDKAAELGLPGDLADFVLSPDGIPSISDYRIDQRWYVNRLCLAGAVSTAATTEAALINFALPLVTFPNSPWTPMPWGALPTTHNAWGTANFVDLTPSGTDPEHAAVYPANGGKNSLFTVGTLEFASYLDGIAGFGPVGKLFASPVNSGSHTLLSVELTDPPTARYLEALGPTEIASDPRRYAGAQDFVDGTWRPFATAEADVANEATETENTSYVDPGP